MLYLPYILIFIAAFSNAVMDVLQHKFSSSVFKNFNPKFWNPTISWTNKYRNGKKENGRKYPSFLSGVTDTFSDAWHIFKLIFILSIITGFCLENSFRLENIPILFAIWGVTFKAFYAVILIRK